MTTGLLARLPLIHPATPGNYVGGDHLNAFILRDLKPLRYISGWQAMLRTDNIAADELDYATTQRELGYALRSSLSPVLWEPLPERIRRLLEQLRDKERKRE